VGDEITQGMQEDLAACRIGVCRARLLHSPGRLNIHLYLVTNFQQESARVLHTPLDVKES
jgi:hypothetical protein